MLIFFEMIKSQVKMNEPVCLRFSILDLSKNKYMGFGMIISRKNI